MTQPKQAKLVGVLYLVLLNLILNAIDAMASVQDRARELVIHTQSSKVEEVRVTVHDSGIGLQSDSIERVFKAFHTTKPVGTGMGLFDQPIHCRKSLRAAVGHRA